MKRHFLVSALALAVLLVSNTDGWARGGRGGGGGRMAGGGGGRGGFSGGGRPAGGMSRPSPSYRPSGGVSRPSPSYRPSGGVSRPSGGSAPSFSRPTYPSASRPAPGASRPNVATRPSTPSRPSAPNVATRPAPGAGRPSIGTGAGTPGARPGTSRPGVGAGGPNVATRPAAPGGNRPPIVSNVGPGRGPGAAGGVGGNQPGLAGRPGSPNRSGNGLGGLGSLGAAAGLGLAAGAALPDRGAGEGAGIGNRPSQLPADRPRPDGRPATLPGIGDRPGVGAGIGDRGPGAGDRLAGRGARRDDLQNRLAGRDDVRGDRQDNRGDRQGDRQDNRGDRQGNRQDNQTDRQNDRGDRQGNRQDNRGDRQDNRQENIGDRQDNRQDFRDDVRQDWQDYADNHDWMYHDWHHGYWHGGYGDGWWDHMWDEHPVAATLGLTSWGLNRTAYAFGLWGYTNPYYVAPYAVGSSYIDYSQPLVVSEPYPVEVPVPVETPVTPASPAEVAAVPVQQPLPPGVTQPGLDAFDRARSSFYAGDYATALREIDQAAVAMPKDATVHEFRGLVLFALGRYSEAAAPVHAVLAVGPGWDWTTMVGLYPSVDVYTAQLRALEGYVREHADDAPALFLVSYHYVTTGNTDAAVKRLREVTRLRPDDTVAAEMLRMLGGAAESTPATAAPAKSPDTPTAPPIAAEDLRGEWVAKGQKGSEYRVTLSQDGSFRWAYAAGGKTEEIAGVFAVDRDALALEPDTGGMLVARVSKPAADKLHLDFAGAPQGDKGLDFVRKGNS